MIKTFHVGVKALIARDGKVLLLRRAGDNPYWDVPGGRIDEDESIDATLERELHEELPNIINYTNHGLVHAERLQKDIKPDTGLVLVFFRVTATFDGDEPSLSDEHTEYRWVDLAEAVHLADTVCQAAIAKV